MKAKLVLQVLVPMLCLITVGCSPRPSPPQTESSALLSPSPSAPDPLDALRAQLLTRIGTLSDSDCDFLVLRFQLIPRDEILEPISKPRKDLLRYVRNIVSVEEMKVIDRAINDRRPPEKP